MRGVFGNNIRVAVKAIKPKKYKVDFIMCGHPELIPTMWGQEKPELTRTVGQCPIHNYTCPICGFGVGSAPNCECPERRN